MLSFEHSQFIFVSAEDSLLERTIGFALIGFDSISSSCMSSFLLI